LKRKTPKSIDLQSICERLSVGALIKYLDIYSVALDEPPVGIMSAIPNECVGMIVDVFAAVSATDDGCEEIFWNYEIYRTEGFREVITSEDIEWLAVNDNFKILYSPVDKD
jgi:hypothetical protein